MTTTTEQLDDAPTLTPPLPRRVPRRLVAAAAAAGVAGAVLLAAPRPGIGVPLAALVASSVLVAGPRRRPDAGALVLWALALALCAVAALRASGWLVGLSLFVAVVLVALSATRARTWPALVLALPVVTGYAARAVPWVGRAAARRPRPAGLGAWARGAGLGLGAAVVVAGLLASADEAYADLLRALVPVGPADLGVRAVAGLALAVGVLGLGAALGTPARWEPPVPGRVSAHRAEWALPLALVGAVLLLWVGVQAAELFGTRDPLFTPAGDTYSSRAREGFAQLVAVTLIVLALLAWSARRAGPPGRRPFALLGGALVVLGLVVVASALWRMWDYDEAYGLTVLRFVVAATEVWLGLVLAGCALAWAVRRTDVLALAVPAAGAAWLLVLALAGPDALVAQWNVDRFERTGKIDIVYLSDLSDDAAPALARVTQEPYRSCLLAGMGRDAAGDPWYGWNLARSRARAVTGAAGEPVSPRSLPAWPCRS